MNQSWTTSSNDFIKAANSVPLEKIFKLYELNISKFNNKVICPFKSHKGGRESTASFYFYQKTNTYWCFGCKQGSTPIDFVKIYENISFHHAIEKILNIENNKFIKQNTENKQNDYFKVALEFSNLVYKKKDYKSMEMFDNMVEKYNLQEDGMIVVLNKLIKNMDG